MQRTSINRTLSNIIHTPFLRNIIIVSIVIPLVLFVYNIYFEVPSFERLIIKNTERDAKQTAMYLSQLIIPKNEELTASSLSDKKLKMIEDNKNAFNIEELKIYSKNGVVLYSTDPSEVGEVNNNKYFLDVVMGGNIFSQIDDEGAKSAEGRSLDRDVLEVYIPILKHDSFKGAFELYYDITNNKASLESLIRNYKYITLSVSAILLLIVFMILFQASRLDLERKHAEDALQDVLAGLQDEVAKQTTALRSAYKLIKSVLENLPIGVAVNSVGQAVEFEFINEKFIKYYRTSREDLANVGSFWESVYEDPEFRDEIRRRVQADCASGDPERMYWEDIPITRRGAETTYITARNIPVPDKQLMISTVWDVTERKQMEAKLQDAQKMEAIGNLAGGIAHDFNNILSPIIGYTELLMDEISSDRVEHEYAREIYVAGKRAGDLVKQILAFSRQSEHKLKPVHVQQVLKEALKLGRSTIPSNIEIIKDIQDDCSPVLADATQVHQIAMNLITNAFHAIETNSGKISVRLKETTLTKEDLKDGSMASGDYVELSLSDSGSGIDPGIMNRIFDPYFTTKEPGKGTGLGLAVVYGIVKKHGGEIKVTSELGKGTSFKVYFPVLKRSPESIEFGKVEKLVGGLERILLVDDEEPIARLEKQVLERLGYRVTMRTSSIEALEAFRAAPDAFDLVVSDMTMPNMTGDRLAARITSIRPDIPVILCTGFSERLNRKGAEASGIKSVLMKPIGRYDLAMVVRKVLDEFKISDVGFSAIFGAPSVK